MKTNYRLKYCELLIKQGLKHHEIIPLLKTKSARNKNYWLERGYDNDNSEKMALSRQPGTIEYYTLFKGKSLEEAKYLSEKYRECKIHTIENFIKRYGEIEGNNRWNIYCDKHREKNKFKYKNKKLGWDINTFNRYNKSRSVTLENLINRHGDIVGREKWNLYIKKQKYTKSQQYVVEKYGIDEWNRLCKLKSHTYESYLERYQGNIEIAVEKYNEYLKSVSASINSSKIADEFFSTLVNKLLYTNYKQYYCNVHNQEWFINIKDYGVVFLDFFLRDTGKVIEFYGDYWHANPKKYLPGSLINLRSGTIKKVEEVWDGDRIRLEKILKIPYIKDVKIVWEDDYKTDPNKIINECFNFLIK